MSVEADVTVPLSVSVAAAATFIGNAVLHYSIFGNDPQGYFAFRFFLSPAIVLLAVLLPSVVILCRRVARDRRAVTVRRREAYKWFFGSLIVLAGAASLAFSGFDSMGYWVMMLVFFGTVSALIACVIGIPAMLILTRILGHGRH